VEGNGRWIIIIRNESLRLEATVYREQFNPRSTVPDTVAEDWLSVGTFRAKEKSPRLQQVVDWTLPNEPDADHQN
jgi:hypothetical protein